MKFSLLIVLLTGAFSCCFGANDSAMLAQLKQTNATLRQEKQTLITEKTKLEHDVITLRNRNENLTQQIGNLNEQTAILNNKITKLNVQIEEQTHSIQTQGEKNNTLGKQLSELQSKMTKLQSQLKEQEVTCQTRHRENITALKIAQAQNEELQVTNAFLKQKYKHYRWLFFSLLSLIIIGFIGKKKLHIMRTPSVCPEVATPTSKGTPSVISEITNENPTNIPPLVDVPNELKCPRCGWKHNPNDKVCKNCKTIF